MNPLHQSFSPVFVPDSSEAGCSGDGGVKCEAGRKSKLCKSKWGNRVLKGMKSLLKGHQAISAEASSTPADAWPSGGGESVGSEADALVMGTVLEDLRVLLSASDVDLALCFIDNLAVCGLFGAAVSWKREAYREKVTEFAHSRSKDISAEVAFKLMSITSPTRHGRRASPKRRTSLAPPSEQALLPPMQFQLNGSSTFCSLGSAESACTDVKQMLEGSSSEASGTEWPSLGSSAASQAAWTSARDSVPEKTAPVPLTWRHGSSGSSSTPAFTSEMNSPEACSSPTTRGTSRSSADVNRRIPPRSSSKHGRRTRTQPAQRLEGVSSWQLSAELHPDFNHFLAAEVKQYHVDRVLRLSRSGCGVRRPPSA